MNGNPGALSAAQVDSFKEEGHLILPGFIEEAVLEQWRKQFCAHYNYSLEEPRCQPDKDAGSLHLDPVLGELPQLRAIAHQLGGGQFNGGGCGVQVRWPQENEKWQMPQSGHLDGYPGEGCQAVLMVGATTYLFDVESGGGAFVYWPRSHSSSHRYFVEFPDQIEGSFRETAEWEESGWGIFSDRSPRPAREFTAAAGDLILWHGWLCHSGSLNVRSVPRAGLFSRWVHSEDAQIRREVSEDAWHYWNI